MFAHIHKSILECHYCECTGMLIKFYDDDGGDDDDNGGGDGD